ncbi:MAG: hypothetical protein ACI8XC_003729, partial [Gammaproteobacteria bacterium]
QIQRMFGDLIGVFAVGFIGLSLPIEGELGNVFFAIAWYVFHT